VLGSARAGVRKTVTVLFADAVRGTHDDLELEARAVTDFYAAVREVLEQYGGTVERHAGDAVMAVFGVPVARDDDARRAVAAARELQRTVAALPQKTQLTVGINTGEVLTGEPDTDEELAVGDPVVVAARLQQNAQPDEVLVGSATARLLGRGASLGPPRTLHVRGRDRPLTAVPLIDFLLTDDETSSAPFVGREPELRMLGAALQRTVQTGVVQLVTVFGEAGTGKSRLVREALADVEGVRVVTTTCRGYGDGSIWTPVAEALRSVVGIDGRGAEVLAGLTSRWPQLRSLAPLLAAFFGEADTPVAQADLAWVLARVLAAAGEESPLVLVLEDVHMADRALLDLVPGVVERLDVAPVLFVVTTRPELLEYHPSWGRGVRHVVGLTMRPLAEPAARSLAEHLLPDDPPGVEEVLSAAGGNPLFLEQLAQARAEGATAVAPTVGAVLTARLDRLPLGARRVLECAAVVGSLGTPEDLLPLVEPLTPAEVDEELLVLANRDLLSVADARWSFLSELVRVATLNALAREDHGRLNVSRAKTLAARGSHGAAGWHLDLGGAMLRATEPETSASLVAQAVDHYSAAGVRALSGDLVAAGNLLGRALALVPDGHPRRVGLLTERAYALQLTGDLTGARTALDQAIELSVSLGLVEEAAEARLARVELRRSTDPEHAYAELPALLDEVVPVLEKASAHRGLSLAYQLQASALQYRVRWAAMEAPLARSMHHAAEADDRRLYDMAQSLLVGSMFHGPMPLDRTRQALEGMLADDEIRPWQRASVVARLAGTLALQGEPEEARRLMEEARQVFRDLGREFSLLATAFMSGPIEMLAGDLDAAVRELRSACDGLQAMGDRAFTSTLAALLAEACWRTGDLTGAADAASLSRRLAGVGDVISQVRWRCVQAKLEAVRRNAREAEDLAAQAVQLVVGTDEVTSQGDVLVDAAEVHALLGHTQAAEVLFKDALDRYERKGAPQAVLVAKQRMAALNGGG